MADTCALYDPACEDLARHFLGERVDEASAARLAAHIQTAVEDWIGWHLAPVADAETARLRAAIAGEEPRDA